MHSCTYFGHRHSHKMSQEKKTAQESPSLLFSQAQLSSILHRPKDITGAVWNAYPRNSAGRLGVIQLSIEIR